MVSLLGCQYGNHILYQKYLVTLMVCLCTICLHGSRYALRFTIQYRMVMEKTIVNCSSPDRCPDVSAKELPCQIIKSAFINWTVPQCWLIDSAFYFSYMLAQFPAGIYCDMFGSRALLALAAITSALISGTAPYILSKESWILCAIHNAILGLAQGASVPARMCLLSQWIPFTETSLLVSISLGAGSIGNMTCAMLNYCFIHILKYWPGLFIFWSVATFVWSIIFMFTIFSTPCTHPFVSPEEKMGLRAQFGPGLPKGIPWKMILKDETTWVLLSGQIGHSFLIFTLESTTRMYFKRIIGIDVDSQPFYLFIPFLIQYIAVVLMGYCGDLLIQRRVIPTVYVRTIYTGVGNLLSCTFLVFITFAGCIKILVVAFFTVTLVMTGTIYPGIRSNILDRTRHYAGVITAIHIGIPSMTIPLATRMVYRIHEHNTFEEWRGLFWFSFAVSFFSTIPYLLRTKSERAPWDFVEASKIRFAK